MHASTPDYAFCSTEQDLLQAHQAGLNQCAVSWAEELASAAACCRWDETLALTGNLQSVHLERLWTTAEGIDMIEVGKGGPAPHIACALQVILCMLLTYFFSGVSETLLSCCSVHA